MPLQETGKQRALRIPLDYFKRPDALQRWKLGLAGIAFLGALSWVGAMQLRHDDMPYSRGHLAAVHATWDRQCAACHQAFVGIGADNVEQRFPGRAQEGDLLCTTCHAGPPHHADQRTELTPTCAACHREHQGRNALLTRNADQECTGCHRDLAASRTGDAGGAVFSNSIHSFTADHPDFRAIKDPRKLKFNHQLHLTRGLVRKTDAAPWTFSNMGDPKERQRYQMMLGETDVNAAVQLNCAACHQADASKSASPNAEPASRPAGAYMQPINYENHCQACHPLNVPVTDGKEIKVPHHLQPAEVGNFLWGALAKDVSRKREEQARKPTRPLPGAALPTENDVRRQLQEQTQQGMKFLEQDRLEAAEKLTFRGKTTCGECHYYERPAGGGLWITPTQIPTVWFQHARFDHKSHRAVDCLSCHEATAATKELGKASLPGVAVCKECHGPLHGSGKDATGGAESSCVECHQYHNGDAPAQGIGAFARDPKKKFNTPGQFNAGSRPP